MTMMVRGKSPKRLGISDNNDVVVVDGLLARAF